MSPIRTSRLRLPRALRVLPIVPAFLLPAAVHGQSAELTLERIHASAEFNARGFGGAWMADGTAWALLEGDGDGNVLLRVDARTGQRTTLIEASELVPAGGAEPLGVESFAFSADERKVLLFSDARQVWRSRTKGLYWVFDMTSRRLTPVSRAPGWQMFAKFSPDGGRVAYVRDHDLWLTDLATGEERRLTSDGSEAIINGTTDWVYEEELGLRDAFRWSPDGRRIAYWQLDQSPILDYPLVDETTLYPTIQTLRYPKAGTPNSTVRVGSLDLETGETTWLDLEGESAYYIPRMEFAASPTEVVIQTLNRHQNRLELHMGDVTTGATRTLLVDEDSAWVDVNDDIAWTGDGRSFVWTSDRDGWNHIYLYGRDGSLRRQLTRGPWDVTGVLGLDDEDRVYFRAAYGGPLSRSVLSVDFGGDLEEVLHSERGTWEARFNADFSLVVDTYSDIERPPVVRLSEVRGDGTREIRVLEDNAELATRLTAAGLAAPEFIEVEAADGTPLNGFLIKPADFDPAETYGLLMYVYGGPGSQTVADSWGGSRYVWHQYLAQRGVLVASVDNRGTGARGREFRKQTYLRLGELETADQIAAARQLGALPYVDADKVGIWGWSYGGYMTLMSTLRSEGAIAAGVSIAPVADWQLYDTIYTERYMRTPQENPAGYRAGSPVGYADGLEVPLLIVHGTGDDNVHPQNTIRMIEALEEAGKQFDMRLYPNKNHSISGGRTRLNLFRLITDFVMEHLLPAGRIAA